MYEFQSEKIKELRVSFGMSQKELATRLGISDRAVSKWETGLSLPTVANVIHLTKIFGVSIDYFVLQPSDKLSKREKSDRMESLKELYKVGRGPSSSHTIGPERACRIFKEKHPNADRFCAILYGSLARTGKGHGTEQVIKMTFAPTPCDVVTDLAKIDLPHPNTMKLIAYEGSTETARATVKSVGGGSIVFDGECAPMPPRPYNLTKFSDIADYCRERGIRLWQYVKESEESDLFDYLSSVWEIMKSSVQKGLCDEGILPGGLEVAKKAKFLYECEHIDESAETRENRIVCAYAFAVSEQNASGERSVTSPTCGSAGVLPAVLYYQQQKRGYDDAQIVKALATAGIIGGLIKTNASISGAECGCQVEIGSACAMAAAALGELFGLSIDKIEYAAEIAIEHHLGLTCDPICGLVQIPCIERNAVAAMRAINAVSLASFLCDTRKISLDKVIKAMKETGHDMRSAYKETSEAGLAKIEI